MHHGPRGEIAGEYLLRQRVLDPTLDRTLERARAVDRVVADGDQLVERLRCQLQAQLTLGQTTTQTS